MEPMANPAPTFDSGSAIVTGERSNAATGEGIAFASGYADHLRVFDYSSSSGLATSGAIVVRTCVYLMVVSRFL
jgi:hypothetical protein